MNRLHSSKDIVLKHLYIYGDASLTAIANKHNKERSSIRTAMTYLAEQKIVSVIRVSERQSKHCEKKYEEKIYTLLERRLVLDKYKLAGKNKSAHEKSLSKNIDRKITVNCVSLKIRYLKEKLRNAPAEHRDIILGIISDYS